MRSITTMTGILGLSLALPVAAGFNFDLGNGDKLSFGGYLKVDARYVSGDVTYQDYWRGNNPGMGGEDHFAMNVRETRLNTRYTHGDVSGFIEMDFYGGGGNEVATNSSNPRLRHAFIKYKSVMAGQYWSNFMPLAALSETLDFAGPIVGEVFIRQPQIRFTRGGFRVSIENPENWGADGVDAPGSGGGTVSNKPESLPDITASYTVKGDWGEVTAAALVRRLKQTVGNVDETAVAANLSGKIKIGQHDDLRFQLNIGESGRYVGAGMTNDVVLNPVTMNYEVEETIAYTLSYRHAWSEQWRSSVYYGAAETDVIEIDRSHWGVNLVRQLTPQLSAGFEVGNFSVDDKNTQNGDADFAQFSMKFAL